MGRNGPKCDSRRPKSRLSCQKAACFGELDYPATFIQAIAKHVRVYKAAVVSGNSVEIYSAVCCCRLLHPELSPRWSVFERGPRQPPWLTRQTRPAGRRPPGTKGHTRLHATSCGRRSSGGVESDPARPWAGSSSSTPLWMVRSSCVVRITTYSLL